MISNASLRITPRAIAYSAVGCAACWALLRVIGHFLWHPAWGPPESSVLVMEGMIAYGIAMVLCFQIAGEYRHSHWLRTAWFCLAIKSAVAVLRYALDDPMINLIRPGYYESPWSGLARELPMAIALSFLVAGMLAMAFGFLRMGLGFRLERWDWTAIVGVVAVLVVVIYFRHELSAARWKSMPLVLQAQIANQILWAVAASLSLLLYRLSLQMGGGRLAAVMRILFLYIVLRSSLVFVSMVLLPSLFRIDRENFVTMFLYQATPWLFTLAAVYRFQLSSNAARQAAEMRALDASTRKIGTVTEDITP